MSAAYLIGVESCCLEGMKYFLFVDLIDKINRKAKPTCDNYPNMMAIVIVIVIIVVVVVFDKRKSAILHVITVSTAPHLHL